MLPTMSRFRAHRRTTVITATVVMLCWFVVLAPAGERGTGNYLVITAPAYDGSAALTQFVQTKAGQGFDVSTYVVDAGTSNSSIRAYIASLWDTPDAPAYVLLIGDTDGYTSGANTIPHWTGQASHGADTDIPYVCMDPGDDWIPDIPVGRFSVRTTTQLQDVVDKTLYVEAGDFTDPNYVTRATFLATNDMSSGAEETHDWVIQTYMDPAEFSCTRVYARLGGGTSDIANAVNQGCMFLVYGGHSGSGGWSTPAFGQSDVNALTNDGLYGLVFGWSCNTAHYSYDECFGETWQRVSHRGAAAYLSASDYIFWGSWEAWEPTRQLEKYLFQAIFADGIREVGPAWQAALGYFMDDYGTDPTHQDTCRNLVEMYILFGDPSLYLPEASGFRIAVEPPTRSLCSPPTDDAVYAIDVAATGDFNEVVTLSVIGEPPGAVVTFSENAQPPPFTTTLTVSGVTGGSPGQYLLELTGTSDTLVRAKMLELNLSTEAPGAVTLQDPPSGAVDVPRRPTLDWQPVAQTVQYDLEVATDPGFANVVYAVAVDTRPHTLGELLDASTMYFWRVRADNGCGDGGFSQAFTFATVEQPDYFTEQFDGDFDLAGLSVSFIPDGSGDYYRMCGRSATTFPTDPAGGTTLALGDDRFEQIYTGGGQNVQLYGVGYDSVYVGSNGYLTFTDGDNDYSESLDDQFAMPRVSALFDDLNPSDGGTISWKQLPDRLVVTFENVPEYGAENSNSFQFELYFNGEIHITWLGIDATDGLAGLSEGLGLMDDFVETDISSAGDCAASPPTAVDGNATTPSNVPVSILLVAADDGLPNPPGALDLIVTTLPAHGVLSDPAAGAIETVPYTLAGHGTQVVYSPEDWYYGTDGFTFKANDGGNPPDGGDSNEAQISIEVTPLEREQVYSFPLDSDPGWSRDGQWEFGQPTGGGSHAGDPLAAYSGSYVYGYNLAGDYAAGMPARTLTTGVLDCRNLMDVELRFQRWLGVERAPFDHASIEASSDGANWTTVWSNPETTISESSWNPIALDISAVADGEPAVQVRWVMGETDASVTYPGWNIDDVEIWAVVTGPTCPGDIDHDDDVDLSDLAQLLANYGITGGATYEQGDLDGDGDVDLSDLAGLLAVYGADCH